MWWLNRSHFVELFVFLVRPGSRCDALGQAFILAPASAAPATAATAPTPPSAVLANRVMAVLGACVVADGFTVDQV